MTARFVFRSAQAIAFGAFQGCFRGFAHGGNFALVALYEIRLVFEEAAAGLVIAFAHGLFGFPGGFPGRFLRRGLFGGGRRFTAAAGGFFRFAGAFLGFAAAAARGGGAGCLRRSLGRRLSAAGFF